jgi:hypothetical protein
MATAQNDSNSELEEIVLMDGKVQEMAGNIDGGARPGKRSTIKCAEVKKQIRPFIRENRNISNGRIFTINQ